MSDLTARPLPLLSCVVFGTSMRGFWERVEQRFEAPDDPLPIFADVAIALGYGLAPDGKTPSPQSAANARKAVWSVSNGMHGESEPCSGNAGTEAELNSSSPKRDRLMEDLPKLPP